MWLGFIDIIGEESYESMTFFIRECSNHRLLCFVLRLVIHFGIFTLVAMKKYSEILL